MEMKQVCADKKLKERSIMKKVFERTEGINFKRAFIIFFAALLGLWIIRTGFMVAGGHWGDLSVLLERLSFAGLRERVFTDKLVIFRMVSALFVVWFHAILALWVRADGKKHDSDNALWPVLTLFTGLIGWLIYKIQCLDRAGKVNVQEN